MKRDLRAPHEQSRKVDFIVQRGELERCAFK